MSLRLRLVSAARGRGIQFAPESFTKMIASDSLNFPPELPRRVTSHSGPGDRLPRAAAGLGLPAARQPERRGIRVIIMIIKLPPAADRPGRGLRLRASGRLA